MNFTLFHIIWTIVAFVFFIAVVIWAWSGKRKKDFDRAARMPLEDDKPVSGQEKKNED